MCIGPRVRACLRCAVCVRVSARVLAHSLYRDIRANASASDFILWCARALAVCNEYVCASACTLCSALCDTRQGIISLGFRQYKT